MTNSRSTNPTPGAQKRRDSGRRVQSASGPSGGDGPTLCGDIDIRIARDGTWYHEGAPIGRKSLVKLFASVLRRDEHGDFWLVTPAEKAKIQVEDAPFLAVEMSVNGQETSQELCFRLNIDEIVMADAAHRIRVETNSRTGEPTPYVKVRDGLEARIGRAVYYDLVDLGVEGETDGESAFGVWSGGVFHRLGKLED